MKGRDFQALAPEGYSSSETPPRNRAARRALAAGKSVNFQPIEPEGYNRDETRQLLRCGSSTVDRLIASGRLKTFTVGSSPRGLRITSQSIRELVAGRSPPT